jgi:hypothetical protein
MYLTLSKQKHYSSVWPPPERSCCSRFSSWETPGTCNWKGSIQLLLLILVTRVVWGRHLSCSVTSKEPTKKATRQLLVWRAVHDCIITIALTPTPNRRRFHAQGRCSARSSGDHANLGHGYDNASGVGRQSKSDMSPCEVQRGESVGKGGQRFERLNLTLGVVCSGARQV